jgi:hypothetical protein
MEEAGVSQPETARINYERLSGDAPAVAVAAAVAARTSVQAAAQAASPIARGHGIAPRTRTSGVAAMSNHGSPAYGAWTTHQPQRTGSKADLCRTGSVEAAHQVWRTRREGGGGGGGPPPFRRRAGG